MTEYIGDKLRAKYPSLFANRCEISVDEGWFSILDALCSGIVHHLQHNKNVIDFAKRKHATEPTITSSIPDLIPDVQIVQIKEKFGTLRFYFHDGDDYIRGAAAFAEDMSALTCEVCGHPGKARGGGWIKTLCELHAKIENRT